MIQDMIIYEIIILLFIVVLIRIQDYLKDQEEYHNGFKPYNNYEKWKGR